VGCGVLLGAMRVAVLLGCGVTLGLALTGVVVGVDTEQAESKHRQLIRISSLCQRR